MVVLAACCGSYSTYPASGCSYNTYPASCCSYSTDPACSNSTHSSYAHNAWVAALREARVALHDVVYDG